MASHIISLPCVTDRLRTSSRPKSRDGKICSGNRRPCAHPSASLAKPACLPDILVARH